MTHAFPTRRASELALLARQGTRYANLIGRFTGPTAVTTSTDPVSAAKAIVEIANSNDKLTIVGGGLGERALSPDEVKALAKTPSLDESRAKLRSEEHTSELQSLMRISYAVFCLKKKNTSQ